MGLYLIYIMKIREQLVCEDILAQYMEGKCLDGWGRLSCYMVFAAWMCRRQGVSEAQAVLMDFTSFPMVPAVSVSHHQLLPLGTEMI